MKRKVSKADGTWIGRRRAHSVITEDGRGVAETIPPTPVKSAAPSPEKADKGKGKAPAVPTLAQRRAVHVNLPLPQSMLNPSGDPITRYVRNKVRTSKYTIFTFIPKNLFEQFRRVANIYFLALVILQLFSIFGAPNAQIGMLPLLAILGMTAIKDGIEDWRRATLDEQVNNSATTKLGGWRNVNQPRDPRSFFERLLGVGSAPGRTTKGVKKLRAQEASAGKQIVMDRQKEMEDEEVLARSRLSFPLDDIPSVR